MKRLTLSALMVLGSASMFALPTYNPMSPALHKESLVLNCTERKIDCCQPVPPFELCAFNEACAKGCLDVFSISLGYYGDFVFDRKLHLDSSKSEFNKASLHRSSIRTNGAILHIGIWDRFQIFGVVGGTNITINTSGAGWHLDNDQFATFTTNTTVGWGVGGNVILYSAGCLAVGFSSQYFQAKPELERVLSTSDIEAGSFAPVKSNTLKHTEWQAALGTSYWIHVSATGDTAVVPYFNIKYSDAKVKPKKDDAVAELPLMFPTHPVTSSMNFGVAIGATFVAGNKFSVGAEGRFNDENALFVTSEFRF